MYELQARLACVHKKVVFSTIYDYAAEAIECNRAGNNETTLSKKQIIEQYCL